MVGPICMCSFIFTGILPATTFLTDQHSNHTTGEEDQNQSLCKICNRRFSSPTALQRHLLTHTHIKPYKCTMCHQSFSRKYSLDRHMLLHTDSKPFACHLCPRRFRESFKLKLHYREKHDNVNELNLTSMKWSRSTNDGSIDTGSADAYSEEDEMGSGTSNGDVTANEFDRTISDRSNGVVADESLNHSVDNSAIIDSSMEGYDPTAVDVLVDLLEQVTSTSDDDGVGLQKEGASSRKITRNFGCSFDFSGVTGSIQFKVETIFDLEIFNEIISNSDLATQRT